MNTAYVNATLTGLASPVMSILVSATKSVKAVRDLLLLTVYSVSDMQTTAKMDANVNQGGLEQIVLFIQEPVISLVMAVMDWPCLGLKNLTALPA